VTVKTALHQGATLLEKSDVGVPRLTAEVLLSHAMRRDRSYLFAHSSDELTELAWIHYGRYLNERLNGKPTQYITHRQEFYGRDFFVDERVLIPRPETEHLVETALAWLQSVPKARILDVGTGSGAIAISVALESGREVLASDLSTDALQVAEKNRRTHEGQVSFFACDLLAAVQADTVDLLLSNPPYVPGQDAANMQREVREWEPHVALFAGDTGFEIYGDLIAQASHVVRSGGRLLIELGYRSLEGVRAMLSPRWSHIEVVSDLAGLPRVLGASKI
jgi:release factor glutamine methyltransferase